MKSIAQIIHQNNFPIIILASNGNRLYGENSYKFWWKTEYDLKGKKIYFENSNGWIVDNRS